MKRFIRQMSAIGVLALLSGCAFVTDRLDKKPVGPNFDQPPTLTPTSAIYHDLINLPPPKGKILAAVYGFRDQTGQYKKQPASNFSTAVTQGAASMLVKAMLDSGWFIPVEREGLQNLLTERKIIRAALKEQNPQMELAPLLSANILIEGGIVAYDSNVVTGGVGVRYFGLGASDGYRMDQVTISLRAVDVRAGRVLANVLTSKTIYSYQVDANLYRFVRFSRLLEAEAGFTRNEPSQLCVLNALEAGVAHLIAGGIRDKLWELANPDDVNSPIIQAYLNEQKELRENAQPPTELPQPTTEERSKNVFLN